MSHPLTRDEAIAVFAGSSASYYKRAFALIGQSSRKVFSFNPAAALLGPIWLGGRRLWAAFWPFLIAELLALIIIAFAVGGGLTADVQARAARLETLAASRTVEAQAAESKVPGSAIATSLAQSARALEKAAREARAAETASSGTPWIIALGIALFIGIRFALGSIANSLFERSFRKWRANGQKTGTGFDTRGAVAAAGLMVLVVPVTLLNFVSAGTAIFDSVPANPDWNSAAAAWLDQTLSAISRTIAPAAFGVTRSIDVVLGLLESALIATPWPVVMTIILALAWQIAGFRIFLLTAVAITYLALLGYWEKSMQTVALLGTAALISIAIGIPLGIACGYNKRLAAGVRPVLDFIEEMRDRLRVDVEPIGNEGKGDACGFRPAGRIDEELEIDAGVGRAARMFPGVHMATGALQHDAERNVFLNHRRNPFCRYQAASDSRSLARRSMEAKRSAAQRPAFR
jgi:glycine betaine/proline transport system permease protein